MPLSTCGILAGCAQALGPGSMTDIIGVSVEIRGIAGPGEGIAQTGESLATYREKVAVGGKYFYRTWWRKANTRAV